MPELRSNDFGTSPLYILRHRPPLQQAVLNWIWQETLRGQDWSFKFIAQLSGTTGGSVKKVIELLAKEGAILEVPVAERKSSKSSDAYKVNCEFVPVRDSRTPNPPKAKVEFPAWAFDLMKIWKPIGVIGPKTIYTSLLGAVAEYGEVKVADALRKYVRTHDHSYSSPKNFAEHITEYLPRKESTRPQAASW